MSLPIYAIGDIHGQMQELDRVLELIKKDGGSNASVFFRRLHGSRTR
jgi:serine/threonine protein phosphatase 1